MTVTPFVPCNVRFVSRKSPNRSLLWPHSPTPMIKKSISSGRGFLTYGRADASEYRTQKAL